MNKTFKSRIGLEFVIPIIIIFGTILFLTTYEKPSWLGVFILLAVITIITHLFLSTSYTIEGENLKIKSGIFYNKTVHIKDITSISETNSFLSSPATSLDRLAISFGKYDCVIISPKQKKEFIDTIVSLNSTVEVKLKKK
ncbi:MAG: PH domain-containing protein [Chitinophagaceae bacterium]|nr:PH domain-containing protein [Chitinophagaceae bacterium]